MQKISSNIPSQISERNKKARDVLLEPAVHQIFFLFSHQSIQELAIKQKRNHAS